MRERRIRSGNAELFAVEAGSSGPGVVLLHAGVADHRMWSAQLGALAARATALAYDRRGFGRTTSPDEPFSHVEDAIAVADALGPGPVTLVGCSQGGRIAVDLALARPDRVSSLVLIAPAISGWPDPESLPPEVAALSDALDRAESEGDLDRVNELEARVWLDGPSSPPGRVGGAVRALFLDMNGRALRGAAERPLTAERPPPSAVERLGQIGVPVRIVCGTLDLPHLRERCAQLAASLGGDLREIEGVAHLPSMERPDEVSRLVLDLLPV